MGKKKGKKKPAATTTSEEQSPTNGGYTVLPTDEAEAKAEAEQQPKEDGPTWESPEREAELDAEAAAAAASEAAAAIESAAGAMGTAADSFEAPPSTRFVWLMSTLVGCRVSVRTRAGSVYDGILHTAVPGYEAGDDGVACTLRMATLRGLGQRQVPVPVMAFAPGDFVSLTAEGVATSERDGNAAPSDLLARGRKQCGFATDSEISAADRSTPLRELTPWRAPDGMTPASASAPLETAAARREIRRWDQFAENQRKFGVGTSFREELYTTALDKDSEFFRKHAAAAERTAAEIEGEAATNIHLAEERGQAVPQEMTEEERYGAVIVEGTSAAAKVSREGIYIPPQKRTPAGAGAGKAAAGGQVQVQAPSQNTKRRPPPLVTNAASATVIPPSSSVAVSDSRTKPLSPLATAIPTTIDPSVTPPSPLNMPLPPPASPAYEVRLPKSYIDAMARPRSHSDIKSAARFVQGQSQAQPGASSLGVKSSMTPPLPVASLSSSAAAASSPRAIIRTYSTDSLPRARRSPVVEFQAPSSPQTARSTVVAERIRLRQALVGERFHTSGCAEKFDSVGKPLSPLMSPLVDDPKGLQALSLEPGTPTVSSTLLKEFQMFKLSRSEGSREADIEELKQFQKTLSERKPSPVMQRRRPVAGKPTPPASPRSIRKSPLQNQAGKETAPAPSVQTTATTAAAVAVTATAAATATATAAAQPAASPSPKPADATKEPAKEAPKLNPNVAAFNPNATSFNPNVTSFNPKASSFTPRTPVKIPQQSSTAAPAALSTPSSAVAASPAKVPVTVSLFVKDVERMPLRQVMCDGLKRLHQHPQDHSNALSWPGNGKIANSGATQHYSNQHQHHQPQIPQMPPIPQPLMQYAQPPIPMPVYPGMMYTPAAYPMIPPTYPNVYVQPAMVPGYFPIAPQQQPPKHMRSPRQQPQPF